MKITGLSTGSVALVRIGEDNIIGKRVNSLYWGVDAFFGSPALLMGATSVLINVSWS